MLHMPILNSISKDILGEHHLWGFYFSKIEKNPIFKTSWLNTWAHNEILLKIAKDLFLRFPDLVFLKGISLLENIYDDLGSRFMSDIDILVSDDTFSALCDFLTAEGYQIIEGARWYGNDFKVEFNKVENGREINIELHSRLFYHCPKIQWNTERVALNKLSLEDNLVHIIGHCGFSHNFQKLYWLVDIYLYLERHEAEINLSLLLKRVNELKLNKVFAATMFILDCHFSLPKKFLEFRSTSAFNFLLNKEFLVSPNQTGFNQYLVKHLFRDSIYESFKYDFLWLKNKISSALKK